jgi:NADH-quinone oxidoreductase subunit H
MRLPVPAARGRFTAGLGARCTRLAAVGVVVLTVVACADQPRFPSVRDVRPTTLERGDTLVVELDPGVTVAADAETRVVVRGTVSRPGRDDRAISLLLPARVGGPGRVLVSIDDYVAGLIDGRAAVSGSVAVEQKSAGTQSFAAVADTGTTLRTLSFFPRTPRAVAHDLFGGRQATALVDWLGIEVAAPADGTGLTVVSLTAEPTPGPAAAAGLAVGDVIVQVDNRPVRAVDSLVSAWPHHNQAMVPVTVIRAGTELTFVLPAAERPRLLPTSYLLVLVLLATGLIVILPIPLIGGLIVVWERKISGYIQSRPGPNRVGPNGWLQWLADGVKLIVKEDIIPSEADPILFRVSPLLVFSGVFATFVVIPFSPVLQAADLDIGILYLLSVTSIVVVGVIMGGWASNSKWSLLGGMRSAAQIISYELPASVAVLSVVVLVGSLSTQDLVRAQGGAPWNWHLFANPFTYVSFFIFFISALAEGNRTPFDLPEAESELVSGYNTEYSGFRFSIFALAEWVNLVVIGAVTTTVFLGGWNIPGVAPLTLESSPLWQVAAFLLFAGKVTAIVFVCIWIRWTLPRFRIDHMMNMCWKYFLPIALVSLMGVALWSWLVPAPIQAAVSGLVFAVGGIGVAWAFVRRVQHVRRTTTVWDLRGA